VVFSEGPAIDVQGLLVKWPGLRVLRLRVQVGGDVVVALGRVGVALAQGLAPDVQDLPEQRPRLRVPPLGVQVDRNIVVT
jgi:hypothetical protein